MVVEINNLVQARVSKKFICLVLTTAYRIAKSKKKIHNLSVALVDKKIIKSLNKKYRKRNKVTDVLSFNDPPEIIICWDQLVKNAKEYKQSQKKELTLLLVHSLLHIFGYDHRYKKQQVVMDQKTHKITDSLKRKNFIK